MTTLSAPLAGASGAEPADADLVARSLRGESEAFATLFDRYATRVYNVARCIVGDRADVDDITQDTFVQALSALSTLRRPEAFGAWVSRIATNVSMTALRRRQQQPQAELTEVVANTHPDPARWGAPEPTVLATEEQQLVRLTLDRLSPAYRRALAMREIGGLSYSEIASTLGTTNGSVEVLLFRARARFRSEYHKVALGAGMAPAMRAVPCQQTHRVVAVLADTASTERERAAARTHAQGCVACTAALQDERETRRALLVLPWTLPAAIKGATLAKVGLLLGAHGAAAAVPAAVGGTTGASASTAGGAGGASATAGGGATLSTALSAGLTVPGLVAAAAAAVAVAVVAGAVIASGLLARNHHGVRHPVAAARVAAGLPHRRGPAIVVPGGRTTQPVAVAAPTTSPTPARAAVHRPSSHRRSRRRGATAHVLAAVPVRGRRRSNPTATAILSGGAGAPIAAAPAGNSVAPVVQATLAPILHAQSRARHSARATHSATSVTYGSPTTTAGTLPRRGKGRHRPLARSVRAPATPQQAVATRTATPAPGRRGVISGQGALAPALVPPPATATAAPAQATNTTARSAPPAPATTSGAAPARPPMATATAIVTPTPRPSAPARRAVARATPTGTGRLAAVALPAVATSTATASATASGSAALPSTVTPTETPARAAVTTTRTPAAMPVVNAPATGTPTRTATPAQSRTPTLTNTPRATVTPTSTNTPSASATPTETTTNTATRTPSQTPTRTSTATPTPSYTATTRPTNTATSTATETSTATPSASPTGTATATPTTAPSDTPTSSSTPTPGPSSPTPPSATATPTASATASSTATATASPTPGGSPGCPAAPWACGDVGSPLLAGGQSVDGSLWTVWGAGRDIWHRQDRFHFLSQPRSGDISLSARVIAQTATHPWAKAGLMIRASTAPSAPNIGIFVTPARGVVVQYRAAPGASAVLVRWVFRFAAPLYLRLDRRGTTFTAAVSPDGARWTVLATLQLPGISADALAGLAVTSHQPTALSRVVFDGVTISP